MRYKLTFAFLLLLFALPASAANIYVAAASAGANNGTSCANARIYTSLVAGDYVPDNVIHLCGTITGAVGATGIPIQGSGTSGHPITILFETNAILTSPAWGYSSNNAAAIFNNGFSYITIDGGTNGLIRDTANGSGLANGITSTGVYGGTGTNVTVKNLTISNLFVAIPGLGLSCVTDSTGIEMDGSNQLVTNNKIDHSRIGIHSNLGPAIVNIEWANNTLSFVQHGLYAIGGGGASINLNGLKIHDNDIGGGAYLWDSGSNNCFHHDPIHLSLTQAGQVTSNVKVYNNYIHGLWSNDQTGYPQTHMTAMIFIEALGPGTLVFNNVLELDAGALNYCSNGCIFMKGSATFSVSSSNTGVYNNTIVSNNGGTFPGEFLAGTGGQFKNNIVKGFNSGLYTPDSEATTTQASDYNDVFGVVGNLWGNHDSLAGWQSHSQDVTGHSVFTDPNINISTYIPNAGSPAINTGTNLTSLGIAELNADKNGGGRPATGNWTMGALNFSSVVPATPTGVTVTWF
jgi:hypothetical protein